MTHQHSQELELKDGPHYLECTIHYHYEGRYIRQTWDSPAEYPDLCVDAVKNIELDGEPVTEDMAALIDDMLSDDVGLCELIAEIDNEGRE